MSTFFMTIKLSSEDLRKSQNVLLFGNNIFILVVLIWIGSTWPTNTDARCVFFRYITVYTELEKHSENVSLFWRQGNGFSASTGAWLETLQCVVTMNLLQRIVQKERIKDHRNPIEVNIKTFVRMMFVWCINFKRQSRINVLFFQ